MANAGHCAAPPWARICVLSQSTIAVLWGISDTIGIVEMTAALETILAPALVLLATFPRPVTLEWTRVLGAALPRVVVLALARVLTGVLAATLFFAAGVHNATPFWSGFWPLLHGTCTLAKDATHSVQAAIKASPRNVIFFKEFSFQHGLNAMNSPREQVSPTVCFGGSVQEDTARQTEQGPKAPIRALPRGTTAWRSPRPAPCPAHRPAWRVRCRRPWPCRACRRPCHPLARRQSWPVRRP